MKRNDCNILINGLPGKKITDDPRPVFTLQCNVTRAYDSWHISIFDSARVCSLGKRDFCPRDPDACPLCRSDTETQDQIYRDPRNSQPWLRCSVQPRHSWRLDFWAQPGRPNGLSRSRSRASRKSKSRSSSTLHSSRTFSGGHDRLRPCQEIKKDFTLDSISGARRGLRFSPWLI